MRSDKKARPERLAAYFRGHRGERLAALMLRLKGYRILARRYKTPVGEIDLIARRGRRIAFIEVKARRNLEEAVRSIGPRQQGRIRKAAAHWLAGQARAGRDADCETGFDLVIVTPWRWPAHLVDAFSHLPY